MGHPAVDDVYRRDAGCERPERALHLRQHASGHRAVGDESGDVLG